MRLNKLWFHDFVHNAVVHPIMAFLPYDLGDKLHDKHAEIAFREDSNDSGKDADFFYNTFVERGRKIARLGRLMQRPYTTIDELVSSSFNAGLFLEFFITGDEGKEMRSLSEDTTSKMELERAIRICEEEADEWESDHVVNEKNYAESCARRIREEIKNTGFFEDDEIDRLRALADQLKYALDEATDWDWMSNNVSTDTVEQCKSAWRAWNEERLGMDYGLWR